MLSKVYKEVYMRTNVVIDDALLNEAFKYTGLHTKKDYSGPLRQDKKSRCI